MQKVERRDPRNDLRVVGVREDEWYMEATSSRAGWRAVCQERTTRDDYGEAGVEQPTCQVQCQDQKVVHFGLKWRQRGLRRSQ